MKTVTGVYESESNISLFRSVYLWVTMALTITGLSALFVSDSFYMQELIFGKPFNFLALIIGELLLVMYLSSRIDKLSFTSATFLFIVYSILNGFTVSSVLLYYTAVSVANTFFISASIFACMSIWGYFTKKDLSKKSSLVIMLLLGLIISSVVNFLLQSTLLYWLISAGGVVLFCGLAAYDTHMLKKQIVESGYEVDDSLRKVALLGALSLYLDFINLFLYLLRFMGDRE